MVHQAGLAALRLAVFAALRCKRYGGANGSCAPKGERNGMWKHGSYASEAMALRRATMQLIAAIRNC